MSAQVRLLVTAADVIHSWTIPALGVKADAVPGRLNQVRFTRLRPGLYYGQCSEICGANHRFMPITVERVALPRFVDWVRRAELLDGRSLGESLLISLWGTSSRKIVKII